MKKLSALGFVGLEDDRINALMLEESFNLKIPPIPNQT